MYQLIRKNDLIKLAGTFEIMKTGINIYNR